MTTLSEKQNLLNDLKTLMKRVEAMETKEESQTLSLPFPEESPSQPERLKGERFKDGSMLIRSFARYLSKRYGTQVDHMTIKRVLLYLKLDCNSRNTSHDWRLSPDMVKVVTELFDIFYKTQITINNK